MPYERDPVSTLFDDAARSLLGRAYAAPGRWVSTRLAGPEARHVAWASSRGINLLGPDQPSAVGGRGLNARSRWARGFVRALFYQHKFWSDGAGGWRTSKRAEARHSGAVEVTVGRWRLRTGRIPAGREIRVRYYPGARAANQAARNEPARDRIYDSHGEPGARWSDPQRRDW